VRAASFVAAPVLAALVPACNSSGTERDFERMVYQAHYRPYQGTEYFADGRAMRDPPEGALPFGRVEDDPRITRGVSGGAYVESIPIAVDREMLEVGRARFGTFCAPCHGALGDGLSVVAQKMELRRPPSLVAQPIVDFPVGRIYHAIENGYGLMPAYGHEMGVLERWSVVGYVRALMLREKGVMLDDLPAPARARALEELR